MDMVFYGKSEAVYAEYSARAEEPYTIAEAVDYDVHSVRGFKTKAAMLAVIKAEYGSFPVREYLA